MKGVDSLHAQGLTAPGTVIVFHARGKQMESTIRACDTGRRIVLSSTQGRVRADYEYTLEDHPDGTRVRLHAQCDMGGFVRLFGPLVRLAIRLSDGDQLEALKAAAEGRPSNL